MAQKHNLSWTAKTLLALIVENTERDEQGNPARFWVAARHSEWVSILNCFIGIGGSGDASSLRGLEAKGYIQRPRGTSLSSKYVYEATEDGIIAFEEIREELESAGRHSNR